MSRERFDWKKFVQYFFFCILFPELTWKRIWKFGEKSMAGLPKLLLFGQYERFQTKQNSSEIFVFAYQPLTFRDKIVTPGKNVSQVVSHLLYVSMGTISKDKHFFKTVLHFHLPHLTGKKVKVRKKVFGKIVRIAFYVFRRTLSGKPILFREKLFNFNNFGFWNDFYQNLLPKIRKIFLHWIKFVDWNVIAEVFLLETK